MLIKIKLKNSDHEVMLDDLVYQGIQQDPYLTELRFLSNLRLHSSKCAVFQRSARKEGGGFYTETIYLHKWIAEKFLGDKRSATNNLVSSLNGDKLDCRLENLLWRSRASASRMRKTSNPTGYTGVYRDRNNENRFRAVIAYKGKTLHLGMFKSVEKAAEAYQAKSKELYGDKGE